MLTFVVLPRGKLQLSRSSAEAEYRGVANAVAETCWLRNLLRELHTPLSTATLVYCDNYADVFTKGLPTALFDEFRSSLSVRSSPAQNAEGWSLETLRQAVNTFWAFSSISLIQSLESILDIISDGSSSRSAHSSHRILHNLFKSSIQATMSGEATKSGDKLQTFNLHVKANDIKQNKTHLTCGNCGMSRHTTDQCFELIGYPDWWNDGHKKGNKNRGLERGKASAANTGTDRKNSTGLGGMAATTVNEEDGSFSMSTTQNYNINQKQSWIFDCGATYTMTYDLSDFATSTKPTKSYIHTENGEKMNVRNGGTIEISPTLKLSNCLYVPALSHKLLSITIIGRGTERQGLYYVDELTTSGTVMLAHGTSEREAWL
ncbi:putative ribonuclease H-like domain-containing protein [Tanacetum coccineum]